MAPFSLYPRAWALADLTACALELDIMGERTADAEAQAAGSYVGLVELMALQLSDYTTLPPPRIEPFVTMRQLRRTQDGRHFLCQPRPFLGIKHFALQPLLDALVGYGLQHSR
jgi:hypothetical protein